MKIVDPNSSVKEGEFSTAENSGGIPSKIRNTYNKVLEGTLLTPEQRFNFLKSSQDLTQAQLDRQKTINDRYAGLAQKMSVDPSLVIQQSPLFSNELVKNQARSNAQGSPLRESINPKIQRLNQILKFQNMPSKTTLVMTKLLKF